MLHQLHQTRSYLAAVDAERIERMVAAAGRGDQSAWSALVARFRGRVLRVARFHGLNAHQADDVAQETWLRLFRNLERVRDPLALGAWVDTTARRECLRALRGTRHEDLTDEEVGVDRVAVEDDTELEEQRVALARAVANLPTRQRELMECLLAESEPSYAEVAQQLGIPIGSIGPTRGRCVEKLRVELLAARS
ncbi:RNA polymerase sigma factor [Solirubrobacter soli]|uniref:RNA polymerase sigma factor n=1 Tax=Solirubrobacter soli TaxID=363832 RepID=UPI000403201D|nr:sigma-70 family RNA polymerase sigma factor [Solirubrobacter soli]